MLISKEDRVALLLGRAMMRAEALAAANEMLNARLVELEQTAETGEEPSDGGLSAEAS